jgi:hypothetical protein
VKRGYVDTVGICVRVYIVYMSTGESVYKGFGYNGNLRITKRTLKTTHFLYILYYNGRLFLIPLYTMSPPPAKRPRQAISHSQRNALRAWYRDSATGSKKTLADASVWWNSQYGYILNSTTASDILSSKYAFLDNNDSDKAANTKRDRGPKWEVLEAALADWALRLGDLLRLKATEFWNKLPHYQGQVCPSWSDGWFEGFKKRHNVRQRRKVGEAGSVQITEEMSAQMERIRAVRSQFLPQDTYNMDETGFYWKRLPSSGLTASSIGKKLDKARITANLCCNQDGSDKVPLWFIGNTKGDDDSAPVRSRVFTLCGCPLRTCSSSRA